MFGRTESRQVVQESYESSSSASGSTYRSAMGPRVTNVQRSRQGVGGSGAGVMTRVYQSMQSTGGSSAFGGGALAALAGGVPIRGGGGASTALVGFNVTRQRDKRELVQLNDKFAQYIEKVRFLEAQNRKLVLELEALRNRSGHGSSRIKEMYDIEMVEANKLIEISKRDAAAALSKAQQAELEVKRQRTRYSEVSGLRETDRKEIDAIERQIAENQAQIHLFRRRISDLEEEARRYKAESQRIASEIGRLQNEIQNELFLKSSCEVEKIALDDELTTLRQTHEADLAELRSQSVSNDLDPSQFFRNELALAIREIRSDYEAVVESQRSEMHNRYSLLYNELIIRQQRPDGNEVMSDNQRRSEERVRTELLHTQNQAGYLRAKNQDVRNRIDELKRKVSSLREDGVLGQTKMTKEIQEAQRRLELANRDYEEVASLKTTLEKEISTYRELLESQNGLRGYVDRIVQNAELQVHDRTIVSGSITSGSVSGSNYGVAGLVSSGFASGGLATGGSTSISRTYVSTGGSSYGYAGSSGGGGISTLISQSTRPATSAQTVTSSTRTYHSSSSSGSPTRKN